jgi:type IV pilus assembly protein PilX
MTVRRLPVPTARRQQRGVSLVIALIALIAMTLAGLALIRAVDTTNLISGNLAFRQATLHTTDVGVETAFATLDTVIVPTSLDATYPAGCAAGACNYYPTRQATNANGELTPVDWSLVPSTVVDGSYSVQYVIDRQCDGPAPVTDVAGKCMRTTDQTAGSKKAGAIVFTSATLVYYRATIRVVGPRDTVRLVQTIFAR